MSTLRDTFEAFIGGDNAAFVSLYREINPRLSAYCHKLYASGAEDLMQSLWERVIELRNPNHSKRGQDVVNPVAFLFRMLKNLAIDEHRRTKEEISLSTIEDPSGQFGIIQEDHTTPLETLILEAFEKLEAEDKELLALNIYSGYKFGEIADMLGLTNDAVWQRASRARKRLKTIVEADARRLEIPLPATSGAQRKETI